MKVSKPTIMTAVQDLSKSLYKNNMNFEKQSALKK